VAKSTKSKTEKSAIDDPVADAIEDLDLSEAPSEDVILDGDDLIENADEAVEETSINPEMDIVDDLTDEAADIVEEESVEPSPPAPEPSQSTVGFLPLLLGGVVAGAIGYGVATYYPMNGGSDDLTAQVSAQADQIAALQDQLSAAPSVDLTPLEEQITGLVEETSAQTAALSNSIETGLSALDERLVEVEKRPGSDGTLSDTALAAYQRELEELRADLDAQQENVMSAAAQAEADLAAARAEAELLEQQAIASAQAAASRAALNRVAAAVETGAPFVDALGDLGGDLPMELTSAAETGVITTAQLTADFPATARAALATARAEGVSGETGGLGGFLRNQFDVRSTSPQEGDGPDAVLSRAEAAVKEGRVADALAEIEALPEVARAEMTDWIAQAAERSDVLNAIATLSETYN